MEKSSKASQVSSPTTLPSAPLILYLPVNLPLRSASFRWYWVSARDLKAASMCCGALMRNSIY